MKRPRVSDHAVLRYLERTGRVDLDTIRQEILTPNLVTAVKAGVTKYKVNGFTFIIENGIVVTVVDSLQKIGPGRQA
jgi:hypothetical protein